MALLLDNWFGYLLGFYSLDIELIQLV